AIAAGRSRARRRATSRLATPASVNAPICSQYARAGAVAGRAGGGLATGPGASRPARFRSRSGGRAAAVVRALRTAGLGAVRALGASDVLAFTRRMSSGYEDWRMIRENCAR